ncbi:MAG: rRNA maturation RNase YbeY [Bacteroidales bacterium]
MAILFFSEDVSKPKLQRRAIVNWLKSCIANYNKVPGNINYIFCSDEYLKAININYLGHDYYTDIITFNYNEKEKLNADIFISIERVEDNAAKFNVNFLDELLRVMIHGILHLVGFKDESSTDKKKMREEETKNLNRFV